MWRWCRALSVLLGLLAAVGVAVSVGLLAYERQLDGVLAGGRGTLRLAVAALDGHLARYEPLPSLIATQGPVRSVLQAPADPAARRAADRYLAEINELLQSSDVYVMLPTGETVAASNAGGPGSFVGENFRYRPYFQAANEGRRGRFFGLGTTSGKRGYYFSAPVLLEGVVGGVVAFKVEIDGLEASWASGESEILVTDPEGIAFMAGRPEWRYRAFEPLGAAALARTTAVRRYAERPLGDLGVAPLGSFGDQPLVAIGTTGARRDYLVLSEPMPEAGWTVRVLLDTASARAQGITAGLAALFLLSLASLGLYAVRQRRHALAERLRHGSEAREELERRVGERTADLAIANESLEREVAERRTAEESLRRAQGELVEAGKLAALGQMSAALSHEFNQPLAAAGAYADNVVILLDRGRNEEARTTVMRIVSLVERMSTLSRHLRAFARRPDEKLACVDIAAAVEGALEIVAWRLKAADARITTEIMPDARFVSAGAVRLQQVLINLVSNAADAVENRFERQIAITARRLGDGRIRLAVSDSGDGVPDAIAPRIFDPFFTTKGVGKGLGLGLSISYNIVRDFGGSLVVERRAEGGAVFAAVLAPALTPAAQ